MESPQPQSPAGNGEETPGQKQARLRRERREAKIKAGGSARLEKITNVSGRQNLPLPDPPPIANPSPSTPDPDEVDLSTHPSAAPRPSSNGLNQQQPTEADIRALLRSAGPQPNPNSNDPNQADDPIAAMLQQIMGGVPPTDPNDPNADPGGLPPGLAAMLGGGAALSQPSRPPSSPTAYIWKVIHALAALLLGIYITYNSHAFTGDISRGGLSGAGHEGGRNVFWAFATAELVLQSGRFFLERGKGGEGEMGGWMGVVLGFLPVQWRGWVRLGARYARMGGTVVEDGMVVVWVVGVVAWWRGAVG